MHDILVFMKSFDELTLEELMYLYAHDIIDDDTIKVAIMEKKKQYYKEKYRYWETSKGIFKVHIYEGGKRKVFERKTEEGMLLFLSEVDADKNNIRKASFKTCYYKWRAFHDSLIDDNSILKYDSEYVRFFEGSDFEKKPINDIDKDCLLMFMIENVKRPSYRGKKSNNPLNKRTSKGLWNTIVNVFAWAEEHGLIDIYSNPCKKISPAQTFYRVTREKERLDERVIIPPENIVMLNNLYQKDYIEHENYIPSYALEFASLTGMRAGEIVSLKWSDIKGDIIYVRRHESYNRLAKEDRILPFPKNKKERVVPITEAMNNLLNKLKAIEEKYGYLSEWIFSGENGRITVGILGSALKNKCKMAGIPSIGITSYRRTVNSLIRANGLSAEAAGAIIGNTVNVNNQYYTFDVTGKEEKLRALEQVNEFMKNPVVG